MKLHPADSTTPCNTPSRRQQTSFSSWMASKTAVVPSGPSITDIATSTANHITRNVNPLRSSRLSFQQAFGLLGVPMLTIAMIAVGWTIWLIILTIAPNDTANYLMNTAQYNNGAFWLIIDPEPNLRNVSVIGLSLVVLGYIDVLLRMTLWRNHGIRIQPEQVRLSSVNCCTFRLARRLSASRLVALWTDTTSFRGKRRKYWNLWLKIVDLTVQFVALRQMLEKGSPERLVYGYTAVVSVNSIVFGIGILSPHLHSAFLEVLIDSIFDLLVAVLFPIIVLAFCYTNFQIDWRVVNLNLQFYPPGSFENDPHMLVDPIEFALFRVSFDSLRIQSLTQFLLQVGMNISFCYRFKRVVELLIQSNRKLHAARHKQSIRSVISLHIHGQRSLPRPFAVLFLAYSVFLAIFSHKSVTLSQTRCAAYPECVVYAHRWDRATSACPCRSIVDINRAPTSWNEWINPVDLTERVKALAETGDLHILYIINRRLLQLPETLRRCKQLQHITLVYTETITIPSWAKELHKLEYLHIEGKHGVSNLVDLPNDLFESMSILTFLHIGIHKNLKSLPSFMGLDNLKVMVLAVLVKLEELPAFTALRRLERLELVLLGSLTSIPDMAPLSNLKAFVLSARAIMCCNGFWGNCDLTHPYCVKNTTFDLPQASCLSDADPQAAETTKAKFEHFSSSVCQLAFPNVDKPLKTLTEMCKGKPYSQCQLPSDSISSVSTGICVNLRMQVIFCSSDQNVIAMRKQQIKLGIGGACDPLIEAWLGCTSSS